MWNNSSCLNANTISTVVVPIFYSIMFVPSILGNLLSLWIFNRCLSRKTSTHVYLLNLAISNVLVSTGMPIQIAYHVMAHHWPYNSTECWLVVGVGNICIQSSMCVSITIFCWIAISRYATLVRDKMEVSTQTTYERIIFGHVLKSFRNPMFAKYFCICVWIAIISPALSLLLLKFDLNSDVCYNEEVEIGSNYIKYCAIFTSLCYFLFLLVVLMFYYFFIKHVQALQANSCIGERYLIHSKVKRNIIIIQVLLVICFAPYHCSKFLLNISDFSKDCKKLSILVEVKNVFLCLATFRSCSDPIVYFCLDDAFKRNLRQLFKTQSDQQCSSSTANKRNTLQTQMKTGAVKQSSTSKENWYLR
ncbi:putative G-protein coupled receptor 82 [Discoglossus pictus]